MKVSRTAWTTLQAHVPVILLGDNGIGKSSSLIAFAKILKKDYVHLPLIGAAPEDLLGYPIVVDRIDRDNTSSERADKADYILAKDKYCTYAPHRWLDDVRNGAILILEEVNRLDNDRMQNVLAQLLDKQLGQYRLPVETIIAGTANIWDVALNEINMNLLTRAAWYHTDVSAAEEERALISGRYDLETTVKVLPDDWKKVMPVIRMKLAAFYRSRPNSFRKPTEGVPTSPWPCPRTIQKHAVPALAAAYAVGFRTYEDYADVVRACCGPVFADDFTIWLEARTRSPQELYECIKAGENIPLEELTIGLSEIFAWILEKPENEAKTYWVDCVNYIAKKILKSTPELAIYLASIFMEKQMGPIPPELVKLVGRIG